MFINAGKTDIPIGTTIKITQCHFPPRVGYRGRITHPFPRGENWIQAIAGFILESRDTIPYDAITRVIECNLMPGDLFEVVNPKTAIQFPHETNEEGEPVYRLTGTYTLEELRQIEVILAREALSTTWHPFAKDMMRAIGNTNGQRCDTCQVLLSHKDLARYPDSESQQGYQNGWYCADHEQRREFQHSRLSKEGKGKEDGL